MCILLTTVDCCWGPWKPYGKCSNPCGPGMQTFRRLPDSPRAKNGGKPCDGSPIKQTPCFLKECAGGLIHIKFGKLDYKHI